jgi:hypothetical protein
VGARKALQQTVARETTAGLSCQLNNVASQHVADSAAEPLAEGAQRLSRIVSAVSSGVSRMGHTAGQVKLNIKIFLQFCFLAIWRDSWSAAVFTFNSQLPQTLEETTLAGLGEGQQAVFQGGSK